jgi:hypothetical protein
MRREERSFTIDKRLSRMLIGRAAVGPAQGFRCHIRVN